MSKYILYGNNVKGSGFGNQIRAFVGAYVWSKILDRELITDNYWVVNCFNLPIKTNYNNNLSKKVCLHDKFFLFDNINFNNFNEDILEFGGGYETSLSLFKNKYHKEALKELLGVNSYYELIKESLMFLLGDVKETIKKDFNYPYNTLQFRSFYDVGSKYLVWLDNFIRVFIENNDKNIPVFVTTDSEKTTTKIMDTLNVIGFKTFNSGLKFSHTNNDKSFNPIIDWYIIGQSKQIFSTGTSYGLSSSLVFNTPLWVYNKPNNINHLVGGDNFKGV